MKDLGITKQPREPQIRDSSSIQEPIEQDDHQETPPPDLIRTAPPMDS